MSTHFLWIAHANREKNNIARHTKKNSLAVNKQNKQIKSHLGTNWMKLSVDG